MRTRCGVTIERRPGTLTRVETSALLGASADRLRALATRPRIYYHRAKHHKHYCSYVPIPLVRYAHRMLQWWTPDLLAIPIAQIAESPQSSAESSAQSSSLTRIDSQLFFLWAAERNARVAARLLRDKKSARHVIARLLAGANELRQQRERIVRVLLDAVEERFPPPGHPRERAREIARAASTIL